MEHLRNTTYRKQRQPNIYGSFGLRLGNEMIDKKIKYKAKTERGVLSLKALTCKHLWASSVECHEAMFFKHNFIHTLQFDGSKKKCQHEVVERLKAYNLLD